MERHTVPLLLSCRFICMTDPNLWTSDVHRFTACEDGGGSTNVTTVKIVLPKNLGHKNGVGVWTGREKRCICAELRYPRFS